MVYSSFILIKKLNKKPIIIALLVFLILLLTSSKTEGAIGSFRLKNNSSILFNNQIEAIATWYALSMPLDERISQLIISGIDGKEFVANAALESLPAPGGFLFFAYNIADTPNKVMQFTDAIHDYYASHRSTLPPLLFLDHEGGQVNRLREVASPLPTAEDIANTIDVSTAAELYTLAGKQMRALGIHINLAPIVESYNEKNKIFLDTRSYGTPYQVQLYAHAAIRAYKQSGMAITIKHFPGNTDDDPHFSLPILNVNETTLFSQYLYPFRIALFEEPEAILLSHVITPTIDPDFPACLSHKTVTSILKKDFSYDGLIVSDDLYMGALSKSGFEPEEAVIEAVNAGVTMIMLSAKNTLQAREVLINKSLADKAFLYKINKAVSKVIEFKIKHGLLELVDNTLTPTTLPPIAQREKVFSDAYREGLDLYSNFLNKEE